MASPRVRLLLRPLADAGVPDEGTDHSWLTEAEASRLRGMRSTARRTSFLAGHWMARALAADWLQVDPARLALSTFADGRPALQLDGAPLPLSLSIAHSGAWLALALGEVAVGVDVELPRRGRDLDGLARMAFSAPEANALEQLDGKRRAAAFCELWTLREACVKRSGEGLRPRQARGIVPQACAVEDSEATSWAFHGGGVALATGVGVRLEFSGEPVAAPQGWRYRGGAA